MIQTLNCVCSSTCNECILLIIRFIFIFMSAAYAKCFWFFLQETKDEQWKRAMDYLKVVSELNYMTQIVIMLYEDPNKVTVLSICSHEARTELLLRIMITSAVSI